MKKSLFIIVSLILFFIVPSKADTIKKTYYFKSPKVLKANQYSVLQFDNAMQYGVNGMPTLPYADIKLLLPPGHEAKTISFVKENKKTVPQKMQLYPKQPAQPYSQPQQHELIINSKIYTSAKVYPEKIYNSYSTHFLHGHSILLSAFTPAEYIPADQTIVYYEKVTIVVETVATERAINALNFVPSIKKEKEIKNYVQNAGLTSSYQYKNIKSNEYDYLMITSGDFEQALDTLVAFYADRGLKSKIVTLNTIQAEMNGVDMPEKIRNYIIQEYQEHQIEYVLLGGDTDVVPYRGFYCHVQSSSVYEDNGIPADVYFSGLDGTWNDNGDSKWGEPDEDDLLLEVSVARMPFSNMDDLENMLNKTIRYQSQPVLGEQKKEFFAAEFLYDDPQTYGSDYLNLHIGFHEDNGYETQGFTDDYDIEKLYAIEVGDWSPNTLMNKINSGKNLLFHVGHANENTVMNLYTSDITNDNFSSANGVDHTFTNIYTHGCICGSFDANDCIGETMVKIDNFAASFIGNSRYGWFNEGQTEGPSQHIHREFTDELIRYQNINIAKAHKVSKNETAPWVEADGQHEEGALRWCFYDCNVLGEPAMMLWTDNPIEDVTVDYPSTVQIGESNFAVTVQTNNQAIANKRIVLKQNDVVLGSGIVDEDGQAIVDIQNDLMEIGNATLLVSGNNMLVHSFNVQIIANEGSYIQLAEFIFNNGNTQNHVFNGESAIMDIVLNNAGLLSANNIQATLSCDIDIVEITNGTVVIEQIAGGETTLIEDAFHFSVQDGIADQSEIPFRITFTSGEDVWVSNLIVIVDAPNLLILDMMIDDNEEGNGNGVIDPGESFQIIVANKNIGHNDIEEVIGELITNNSQIAISQHQHIVGLAAGEEKNTIYYATASNDLEEGIIVEFNYSLISIDGYYASKIFMHSIGLIMETFETGDFLQLGWDVFAPNSWIITEDNTFEGFYSARSHEISDNEESIMKISINVFDDDIISFKAKVSSETNYDGLSFFIDDQSFGFWSGETDWLDYSYPISAGNHTLIWKYTKDVSSSQGDDMAVVDNIIFPPCEILINTNDIEVSNHNVILYPNPVRDNLYINNKSSHEIESVVVYNMQGVVVKELSSHDNLSMINVNDLEKGFYFVEINADMNQREVQKVIVY